MTTFALKMIAYGSMLVDHITACVFDVAHLVPSTPGTEVLYQILRGVGRLAFPIFCFLLIQGTIHTHSKPRYALRIGIFALLSEVPFNLALRGTFLQWKPADIDFSALFQFRSDTLEAWNSIFAGTNQNVDFTLLFGLLAVFALLRFSRWAKEKRFFGYLLALVIAGLMALLAGFFKTDYGIAGVVQIAVFGILALPLDEIVPGLSGNRWFRGIVIAGGILACCATANSSFELIALTSVPFIMLYNGKEGPKNHLTKWGCYLFYPVHLAAIGCIFVLPGMLGH